MQCSTKYGKLSVPLSGKEYGVIVLRVWVRAAIILAVCIMQTKSVKGHPETSFDVPDSDLRHHFAREESDLRK